MKKLIACLAAIVLSCGILAGCGSSVTQEDVAKKAEVVQARIIELGQQDEFEHLSRFDLGIHDRQLQLWQNHQVPKHQHWIND